MKTLAETPTRPYRMRARARAMEANGDRVLDVAVERFTKRAFDEVSLDEIAEQAAVSKRTILRRFDSKENLFVAAMGRAAEEMMRQRNEAPAGDIDGAITNLLDHYERWGENRLRLLAQEERIPVVAQNVRGGRRFHWAWVQRTFAPLLRGLRGREREREVAALAALTDVYTWKILRRDFGLSRSESQTILVGLISKLGKGDING